MKRLSMNDPIIYNENGIIYRMSDYANRLKMPIEIFESLSDLMKKDIIERAKEIEKAYNKYLDEQAELERVESERVEAEIEDSLSDIEKTIKTYISNNLTVTINNCEGEYVNVSVLLHGVEICSSYCSI